LFEVKLYWGTIHQEGLVFLLVMGNVREKRRERKMLEEDLNRE